MGDNKALQKFSIHNDDSRPTKGGFFCAVVGDKIRGVGISYIFFDFTIDDSNTMHYYNNQKRQGDCNLARSKEMIKIKAWFGDWKETDFEGAKRFFESLRKGASEKGLKETFQNHFQGVSYEELRGK